MDTSACIQFILWVPELNSQHGRNLVAAHLCETKLHLPSGNVKLSLERMPESAPRDGQLPRVVKTRPGADVRVVRKVLSRRSLFLLWLLRGSFYCLVCSRVCVCFFLLWRWAFEFRCCHYCSVMGVFRLWFLVYFFEVVAHIKFFEYITHVF